MFYDNFLTICRRKGITPTSVIKEAGISSGNITNWKRGIAPKLPTLKKLANVLGVSVEELIKDDSAAVGAKSLETPAQSSELSEYLNELSSRPEMRMLFSVAKGASKEDIEAIARFIEAMREGGKQ